MPLHINKSFRFLVNKAVAWIQLQPIPFWRQLLIHLIFRLFPWHLFLDIDSGNVLIWILYIQYNSFPVITIFVFFWLVVIPADHLFEFDVWQFFLWQAWVEEKRVALSGFVGFGLVGLSRNHLAEIDVLSLKIKVQEV